MTQPGPPDPLAQALREIENAIARERREIAYVLDEDGRVLVRREGGRDMVSLGDLPRELIRGRYVTHNHPEGNSFSREDIRFLLEFRPAEIRAVTRRFVHIFELPEADVSWEDIADLVEFIRQEILTSVRIEFNVEGADPADLTANFWHRVWAEVSDIREWGYQREERR